MRLCDEGSHNWLTGWTQGWISEWMDEYEVQRLGILSSRLSKLRGCSLILDVLVVLMGN